MRLIDGGVRAGAGGRAWWDAGAMRYQVADGDSPDAIAARFDVEVTRLVDADGPCVQPVPFSEAVWPIAPGDELWFSTQELLELITTRIGCPPGGQQGSATDIDPPPTPSSTGDDLPLEGPIEGAGLPPAHPVFRRWFAGEVYEDEADEFAPFGSDEGADALVFVRDLVHPGEPVPFADLLDSASSPVTLSEAEETDPDVTQETDPMLIGMAFALLRITGALDRRGRSVLLQALERQMRRYGDAPTLTTVLHDLHAFDRSADD